MSQKSPNLEIQQKNNIINLFCFLNIFSIFFYDCWTLAENHQVIKENLMGINCLINLIHDWVSLPEPGASFSNLT